MYGYCIRKHSCKTGRDEITGFTVQLISTKCCQVFPISIALEVCASLLAAERSKDCSASSASWRLSFCARTNVPLVFQASVKAWTGPFQGYAIPQEPGLPQQAESSLTPLEHSPNTGVPVCYVVNRPTLRRCWNVCHKRSVLVSRGAVSSVPNHEKTPELSHKKNNSHRIGI